MARGTNAAYVSPNICLKTLALDQLFWHLLEELSRNTQPEWAVVLCREPCCRHSGLGTLHDFSFAGLDADSQSGWYQLPAKLPIPAFSQLKRTQNPAAGPRAIPITGNAEHRMLLPSPHRKANTYIYFLNLRQSSDLFHFESTQQSLQAPARKAMGAIPWSLKEKRGIFLFFLHLFFPSLPLLQGSVSVWPFCPLKLSFFSPCCISTARMQNWSNCLDLLCSTLVQPGMDFGRRKRDDLILILKLLLSPDCIISLTSHMHQVHWTPLGWTGASPIFIQAPC